MDNSRRVRYAGALLLLLGSFSMVPSISDAVSSTQSMAPQSDLVSRFGRRISRLRQDLPAAGVVGFVSEPPEDRWTNPVYNREIVLARYFLAPLVVLPYEGQALSIGSFHPAPSSAGLEARGLVVVKDYGDGLLLLKHRAR
jgi:hypothetical protein